MYKLIILILVLMSIMSGIFTVYALFLKEKILNLKEKIYYNGVLIKSNRNRLELSHEFDKKLTEDFYTYISLSQEEKDGISKGINNLEKEKVNEKIKSIVKNAKSDELSHY